MANVSQGLSRFDEGLGTDFAISAPDHDRLLFLQHGPWKAYIARMSSPHTGPRRRDYWDRMIEGLRKTGMPEE